MDRIVTNFNERIIREVNKMVAACNKTGTIIQEIRVINDSLDVCETGNNEETEGYLRVEVKVVLV